VSTLTPEEKSAFVDAAAALLAAQEPMELMNEQAAKNSGENLGTIQFPRVRVESVLEPGRKLLQVLKDIKTNHPTIQAFRFRGHIFSLTISHGQVVGMSTMREAAIETVEG
jgi:hypothetical protein